MIIKHGLAGLAGSVPDTTPPSFVNAEVGIVADNKVRVYFDEDLTGSTSNSDWTVTGFTVSTTAFTSSTNYIELTLSTSVTESDNLAGDLSYSGTGLTDLSSNQLATFSGQNITNNVNNSLALYNSPSSDVPVLVLDFEEGVYAKDTGGGLTPSTFSALVTGGTVAMGADGIRRLRCESGDNPTADISSLTLTSGTVVIWYETSLTIGGFERVLQFDNGDDTNGIRIWIDSNESTRANIVDSGSQSMNAGLGITLDQRAVRASFAWATNNCIASANGSLASPDVDATIPTVSNLRLGHDFAGGNELLGGIQRIVIYDSRLSDTDVQTLSQNNFKFVDDATGSDANDGTAGTPWKTIDHAMNNASAGDTVYITAGTYDPPVGGVSGTDLNTFVTFCAEPGDEHSVVIDGGGNPASPTSNNTGQWFAGIRYVGHSFVRLAGLRVINVVDKHTSTQKPPGIQVLAGEYNGTNTIEHFRVTNCQTQYSRSSGIYISGYRMSNTPSSLITRTRNIRVEGCEVLDHNWLDGSNEGISVGGGTVDIQIKDCYVESDRQYGIDLKGGVDGAEIVGCTLVGHERHGIYLDSGAFWVRNCDIHNNIMHSNRNGFVVARERGDTHPNHEILNINFYNNIIHDNTKTTSGGYGILMYAHADDGAAIAAGAGLWDNVFIFNNTIVGHTANAADGIRISDLDPVLNNCRVANNLFWNNGTDISLNASTLAVNNSNISASSDPFVDRNNANLDLRNFRLANSGVDGVNDANATYAPADDFDGVSRPVGGADDAGAFESF